MKAALVQNFKANVNKKSAIERCQIYGKILDLEMRCWNNTQLDTNLNFVFNFRFNSIHCLWYHIFVILHLLFIFKILCPKLYSGSSSWCACSSELDVSVLAFFVTQKGICVHSIIFMKVLESKLLKLLY